MRSARILICFWLSSPDTYSTFCERCSAICKRSVLFPIPGSPPNKMSDPYTIPPPKTRLNSASFVRIRASEVVLISLIFKGLGAVREAERLVFQSLFSVFWTISSTIVFHALHAVHCPCHLATEL